MTDKRYQVCAFGNDEIVATVARLVGRSGAVDLEIGYERADGPPLVDGEEPGEDDAVRWTATAFYPEGHKHHPQVTGLFVVKPGGNQHYGAAMCLANLARELGANVTVIGL